MKQLKKLEHDGMTPEVKAKVYTVMANKAVASQQDIRAEVKKLADSAVATDKTFENIRRQLALVDQTEYKDKFGQPIAKLQPTWVKYQKRYTDLLWQSRDAATKTEAYLRDLTRVVIPLILQPDSTYEDNLKDLRAFINRPNPMDSKSHADDFSKLQADVGVFTEKFSSFAADERAQLGAQITALKESIASLQKELVQCDKLVMQMGIALGVTAGAATIGVILAVTCLGPAAPAAVVAILVAGIGAAIGELSQLIVALTQKARVEGDIAEKQREIDEANKQLEILSQLMSKLQRCSEEASEMFGRLDSFTSIWSMVAQDAELIAKSDLAHVHTDKTVQSRIKLISASYSGLAEALAYYATAIDKADLASQS